MSDTGDRPPNEKSQIWGGRFSVAPDEIMTAINASIGVDQRLWREDIAGSLAHAGMLAAQGIISAEDAAAIEIGLAQIAGEIESGTFVFTEALEDIHMNIEARLKELIGEAAGRLHTARSRNDQVATDFRLWLRTRLDETVSAMSELQGVLALKTRDHAGTIMPGYTHLQTAQPVTFGHHCLAYVEMLERDIGRFLDARERLNECPLGAAALAGTSFPIDRMRTATELDFNRPMANSLDAVSSRDFALEALSALTISATHLSRLAEEMVLWASPHFGFITFSDRFATGSSIMPQKKNPDAAELCRAKVGGLAGAFQALVLVMKGLPLAYSKDMQEDKARTFIAFDDFSLVLAAMTGMVDDMDVNEAAMKAAATHGASTATDLADWLVRDLGLAFRDAHHVTGAIVAEAEARRCHLADLPLEVLQHFHDGITDQVYGVLTVEASVASRTSYGGTSPDLVARQATQWLNRLSERFS
ncbi:MAG: argininosuccinate lyase [Pseudomonadota bacterium]